LGNERREAEEIIVVVEESPVGGYAVRALRVPLFTEADGIRLLHTAPRDAVRCHYEAEADRPRVIRLPLVRDSLIAV